MSGRSKLLWGWWLVVLAGFGASSIVTLNDADKASPAVVRVVGRGAELWAYTQERGMLQGVETAWWVSLDGGATWSGGEPPSAVVDADAEEQTCGAAACYRLVEGVRIERRDLASSTWQLEHERPSQDAPPAKDEYHRDWDAQRSIAVAHGPSYETAAVAAGTDGALVRTAKGSWRLESVGRSWSYGIRWRLVGCNGVAALIGGAVIDQIIRRVRPTKRGASKAH